MNLLRLFLAVWTATAAMQAAPAPSSEFAVQCADRTELERVYYAHRLGTKAPFEEAMPREAIERLVRQDLEKEAVLRASYGVILTDVAVQAEVDRVNSATRAPETLAEIKKSLGNDSARFARTVARPILIERALQACFDNDNEVHAAQRRLAEQARAGALTAYKDGVDNQVAALKEIKAGTVNNSVWQLTPRPTPHTPETLSPGVSPLPIAPTSAQVGSSTYSIDATAQLAQTLSPPETPGLKPERQELHFEDLPQELQRVLVAQLQKPGDVTAVIETPGAFLVFVATNKSPEMLQASSLCLPKRAYDSWLAQQGGGDAKRPVAPHLATRPPARRNSPL